MDYSNMKQKARQVRRRPATLQEIWTEKELCERLGLPVTKGGHSIQLSNWIKGGLRYMEKAGRRYFYEQDVIDYMMSRYPDSLTQSTEAAESTLPDDAS